MGIEKEWLSQTSNRVVATHSPHFQQSNHLTPLDSLVGSHAGLSILIKEMDARRELERERLGEEITKNSNVSWETYHNSSVFSIYFWSNEPKKTVGNDR